MGITELPQGYVLKEQVNLTKNKRQAILVNVLSIVLMIAVLVVGFFWKGRYYDEKTPLVAFFAVIATIVGYVIYIILHELTHGAVMYLVSGVSPKFGVKLPYYAYAGGVVYFTKRQYILVALAPVVLWGAVFGVLSVLFKNSWFWCFCFLQAGNIGGAAGDLFVTVKTIFYPKTVLIYDTGTVMSYYLPTPEEIKGEER